MRLAEAVPRDMIAMPLGPRTRHVVVGAPSYFANRPRPIAPADLREHYGCLYYPGRRHMAASLRAFVDLAEEIVFRNRTKAS